MYLIFMWEKGNVTKTLPFVMLFIYQFWNYILWLIPKKYHKIK